MLLDEIINTCTHDMVAEAAVASIGSEFQAKVLRLATARDMTVGAFVATLVRRFSWRADASERRLLALAMRNAQTPFLAGLRHILETMMREDAQIRRVRQARSSQSRHPLEVAA